MSQIRLFVRFYSKLVRLKECKSGFIIRPRYEFLFQIGAIKRWFYMSQLYQRLGFLFQIGAIKSLSKTNISIIQNPYSSCQVNFYFSRIYAWLAVNLQSCTFTGRLTAVDYDCFERQYLTIFTNFAACQIGEYLEVDGKSNSPKLLSSLSTKGWKQDSCLHL